MESDKSQREWWGWKLFIWLIVLRDKHTEKQCFEVNLLNTDSHLFIVMPLSLSSYLLICRVRKLFLNFVCRTHETSRDSICKHSCSVFILILCPRMNHAKFTDIRIYSLWQTVFEISHVIRSIFEMRKSRVKWFV